MLMLMPMLMLMYTLSVSVPCQVCVSTGACAISQVPSHLEDLEGRRAFIATAAALGSTDTDIPGRSSLNHPFTNLESKLFYTSIGSAP